MEKNKAGSFLKRIYAVLLVIALFTGFGNMPIYKRYYISSIPGLGWAENFYINLQVHYIAGALLLGLAVYFTLMHLKSPEGKRRLTKTGATRAVIFGIALLSGILLAVRNLGGINFPFGPQMAATFIHMGMAILLTALSVICLIATKPWTK
ncbi:MAG: hypothetical protein GY859_06665 [Desulfobacterales bacterium]|nr:hypothetical protein [Desulfobacterales bacterium]